MQAIIDQMTLAFLALDVMNALWASAPYARWPRIRRAAAQRALAEFRVRRLELTDCRAAKYYREG